MKSVGIVSTGSYVPEKILSNSDLEAMVDTSDEWIVSRTGIRERHIASEEEWPADMAVQAAKNCLSSAQDMKPELIISSCGTAEKLFPSQSCTIASRLNLDHIAAFDINAACTGMVCALSVAQAMLQNSTYSTALLTASEKMSSFVDYTDRSSCVLFGDGASAMLVSTENYDHELIATDVGVDPTGSEYLGMGHRYKSPHFWQDGQKLFRYSVEKVSAMIERLMEKAGFENDGRLRIIPHQANRRIIQSIAERIKIPLERFILNMDKYGNTSSASVGIAMHEACKNNTLKKGDSVLLATFGAGFTWAGAAIQW